MKTIFLLWQCDRITGIYLETAFLSMSSAVHAFKMFHFIVSLSLAYPNVEVLNDVKDFPTHDHRHHLSVMREEGGFYGFIYMLALASDDVSHFYEMWFCVIEFKGKSMSFYIAAANHQE